MPHNDITKKQLPAGMLIRAEEVDDSEEALPLELQYSLLIQAPGKDSAPLLLLPLGGNNMEGLIHNAVAAGMLTENPSIPVVGYQSWQVSGGDFLSTLVRLSSCSPQERAVVLEYLQSREYPAHILLNF